jgi:hypothetical protein
MKAICATACIFLATLAGAEVTSFSVRASATDPAIKTFDQPHWMYVNRDIVVEHKDGQAQDRHQLLLLFPGTVKKGAIGDSQGPVGFCDLAANLGYHVVFLKYPNDIPAGQCRENSDPTAFERFRMAIIQGGRAEYRGIRGAAKSISIEPSESIENRFTKLLVYLRANRPKEENWGQFLNEDGTIKWEAIAVSGQSQGGGHAALIGIKHRVARVICTGSPKDYNKKLDAPAAWYREKSATSKGCFFAFNHRQDPMGCTPEQQLENLKALKLYAFGSPVDVDTEAFPYRHSRILTTGYPVVTITGGEESPGALAAHSSVITPKNGDHWKQVWTYLLSEPVP